MLYCGGEGIKACEPANYFIVFRKENKMKNETTVSLIFGIISVCFGILGFALSPVGIMAGIVGIVLGAVSIKKDPVLTGTGRAGFVTAIVGTSLSLIMTLIVYVFRSIDISTVTDFVAGEFLR